ncbi:MAG: DUF4176 domain-containing protein [Clostridiales bacterium]|nr:DUF4176 domain-containing protein [Clostridiales bacterium]
MSIDSILPVGTVVKLSSADRRVVIMGILPVVEDKTYDYIGVVYPEGYMGGESTVVFMEENIETVFCLGFSDIERQQFISELSEAVENG